MKKFIFILLLCGCDPVSEHDQEHGRVISYTSYPNNYLYTVEHDGHWWIMSSNHFMHHPDCRKCFPERLE